MRKINFIGSNTIGMVGEKADEVLLVDELRKQGQKVNFIPRDIWKAHCDGDTNEDWDEYLKDMKSDINIICKWHHFNNEKYIKLLRDESNAPVYYWVWDWMDGFPHNHDKLVKACDLYLSNDVFHPQYKDYDNCYYFPYDCADSDIPRVVRDKKYDVVFFGSYLGQGLRSKWIPEIAKHCNLTIFGNNYTKWKEVGLEAYPAVYGDDFAEKVAESKICLQFSVDDNTWGYWSNRVGKVLTQGGFLLAHYAPGMELFIKDGAEYFNTIEECVEKIKYYLKYEEKREFIAHTGFYESIKHFTVKNRVKELIILIERNL